MPKKKRERDEFAITSEIILVVFSLIIILILSLQKRNYANMINQIL